MTVIIWLCLPYTGGASDMFTLYDRGSQDHIVCAYTHSKSHNRWLKHYHV